MSKECSKTVLRRLSNSNFIRKYFKGIGLDIGGRPDPLSQYIELFPLMQDVFIWDREDGDAQYLEKIPDEYYDFVHSSHCLEHLDNPITGIKNWFRVLKPKGYLILTVPDEDLYEQKNFPSIFSDYHKWTFTIYKEKSWSPKSINILDIVKLLNCKVEKIELMNHTYRTFKETVDQTKMIAECSIEVILKKE